MANRPLSHHRTCGSASGGSVKYDEVGIVLRNSPVRIVASGHCSRRDELAAIWIAAMVLNSFRQREWPSILIPLSLSGSRIGSVASSIASTRFVASDVATIYLGASYVLDRLPRHSSLPIQ